MTKTHQVLIATSLCLAALSFAHSAQAQGASLDAASKEEKKAAASDYRNGMKAFQAKRFDDALAAFEKSYDTVRSPNSRLMIGRTLAALERFGEAYDALQATVRDAEEASATDAKYQKTVDAAKNELKDLEGKVGFVNVELRGAGEGDRVKVAGRERSASELAEPIAVTPGSVSVVLVSASGEETERSVDVDAGETETVALGQAAESMETDEGTPDSDTDTEATAEVDTSKMNTKTLAYVAGGIGIAGMVTFGVFGIMNNGKFDDLEERCPNRVCPADLEEDADTGQTYQTIANIGLVVGVVGLGTSAALFLLGGSGSKEKKEETARVSPRVSVGWRSVVVSGSF
jgi:hypothetical protein